MCLCEVLSFTDHRDFPDLSRQPENIALGRHKVRLQVNCMALMWLAHEIEKLPLEVALEGEIHLLLGRVIV